MPYFHPRHPRQPYLLDLAILGVQEGMGLELSVPGHCQGDSFCLYLTGHVQGLWGNGRDACVLRPLGDLYKVLKVPSFPEKLLQISLKVGHVDSTPSLGVSQSHPQTPLNSLSKSRGHSSGLLCFLQAHEWFPLLTFASTYGLSEFWKKSSLELTLVILPSFSSMKNEGRQQSNVLVTSTVRNEDSDS